MSLAASLRREIADGPLIVAPGAYDCITAKLIEGAGFGAVYMSGGCTAGMLGFPDYGLATMTEMVDNAGRIAGAVTVPVIADADTGYGNELNVTRTVREYELRGIAAIQLEDQGFPKKCGHLDNKVIVPVEEFVVKIRAAAAARRNKDTIIVARTDARAVSGFEDAVARMNASLEAGADVAFLEAPQTMAETEQVPRLVHGPCLLNVVRGGKSPLFDLRQAGDMGYRIAIVPGLLLAHIIGSCGEILQELRETRIHPIPRGNLSIRDLFRHLGSDAWDTLRTQLK
jgi:2-methylisocitrate lyase-like PEP mutase family enzyme